MALVSFALPCTSPSILGPPAEKLLSSLEKECRTLKQTVPVSSRRIARSNPSRSRSVTRCLKGIAFPQPHLIEKLIDGGVPTPVVPQPQLTRKDFPLDFKFGCSTSAFQTEGSGSEGGRGPSTWDVFIGEGQNAVNSYELYKEDVQRLKEMGADTYRMSISWSRILPDGTISGGVNQEGIDFYKRFFDELIKNGRVIHSTCSFDEFSFVIHIVDG